MTSQRDPKYAERRTHRKRARNAQRARAKAIANCGDCKRTTCQPCDAHRTKAPRTGGSCGFAAGRRLAAEAFATAASAATTAWRARDNPERVRYRTSDGSRGDAADDGA